MTWTTQSKAKKKTTTGAPRWLRGREWHYLPVAALTGAALGFSAPGLELWWLAWVALAPLFVLAASSKNPFNAFIRGTIFGTGYNLVYQNWYLSLQPLDWLGFNQWQGWLLAIAAWMIVSLHQGLIIGIFAALMRIIPLTGTFFPEKSRSRWRWPALVVLPFLWVLVINKLGNAHDALGVPFSMIEYTQYKQVSLIQIASITGGIGLGAVMVMANAAVAALFASLSGAKSVAGLAAPTRTIAIYQCLAVALLLTGMLAFGFQQSSSAKHVADIPLSVVQSNINIEMQKTRHAYTLDELLDIQLSLMETSPRGICVWSESSLPAYLNREAQVKQALSAVARSREMDMVIGAMDRDSYGRPFNAAYGIKAGGAILPSIYHKRYLVPFGEYEPAWVQWMPEWVKRLTNTPAGGGFGAGRDPAVLELSRAKVGPLICFETISPEMAASTVRSGAQLLANLSDLAWFHDSMIGRQMIATSVMRAVENRRYFVFAANTGPSAIIDPFGRIVKTADSGKARTLVGKVGLVNEVTPFTKWFLF